ncbi:MAG: type III pantothenate kinase [Candidatus Omnitrophota bacterium]
MKLLIDIGNTNTSIAVVHGEKIQKRYFIHTSKKEVSSKTLKRLLGASLFGIDRIVIVSVVPKFSSIMKKSLKVIAPKVPILFVGKDIKVPMKIKYKNPQEVGQDRLAVSFAAARVYGRPVLVVDFGTAVTFDLVNHKGEYEGGLIFPGFRLGLESLVQNTALLPKIVVKRTKGLIGRDTRGSMNKGMLFGYAAMCDGIVQMFRKKYGKKLKIAATGGDAGLVAKYSRHINKVHPDLIFTGLNFLTRDL